MSEFSDKVFVIDKAPGPTSFDAVEMPECGGEGALVNRLGHQRTVVRFHSPAALIMGCYDVRPAGEPSSLNRTAKTPSP